MQSPHSKASLDATGFGCLVNQAVSRAALPPEIRKFLFVQNVSPMPTKSRLPEIIKRNEQDILNEWVNEQVASAGRQKLLMKQDELSRQCHEFLGALAQALQADASVDLNSASWAPVRDLLVNVSRTRSSQGFTPTETATFVFSLKRPLFARIRKEVK